MINSIGKTQDGGGGGKSAGGLDFPPQPRTRRTTPARLRHGRDVASDARTTDSRQFRRRPALNKWCWPENNARSRVGG